MSLFLYFICIIALASLISWKAGRGKALALSGGKRAALASVPGYYGLYVLLWSALPSILFFILWQTGSHHILSNWVSASIPADMSSQTDKINFLISDIRTLSMGGEIARAPEPWMTEIAERLAHYRKLATIGLVTGLIGCAAAFGWVGYTKIRPELSARVIADKIIICLLWLTATLAVFVTLGIVLSLAFEAYQFFKRVPMHEFLFGTHWSPQVSIRSDQVGSSGGYGAIPVFTGTLLITALALLVAVPLGLLSAIYLSEYANPKTRAVVKPILELLAGIPTVVYGFFAALLIGPGLNMLGEKIGLNIEVESALAAGLTMGVMLIPFISSLSDDVLHAVPTSLHDGSLALGATPAETIKHVVIPAALPGIVGACLLALSRAIGETMIVVMAAGMAANLTFNPFESVTTVTVQVVSLLVGDQEFASTTTLAAFALGLVLFIVTLILNFIALYIVRTYREQYE